jgi:SAM-dependent methyltransferase
VQADVCWLPFADATFDLAYSYGVVHDLGAPERGLRERGRVARPGATVGVYSTRTSTNAVRCCAGRSPAVCRFAMAPARSVSSVTCTIGSRRPWNGDTAAKALPDSSPMRGWSA